jgi:HlyD family secretion protein
MTAYVTIPVATVENALKLPNTALRYKPPMTSEEILAVYKQYGIDGNGRQAANAGSEIVEASERPKSETQSSAHVAKTDTAVVWKLGADNALVPVKVSLGITDHEFTEILGVAKGELKDGDALVIRSLVPKNQGLGTLRR